MFQVFSLIAWSSLIERVWSNLFWMGGRSGNRELPFPSSFQDFNASHIALLDNPKLIIIRLRLCLFKIQLSGTALAHMINEDNIEDICSIYFNLSFGELLCFNISVGKRNFLSGADGGGEFIPVISNPLTAQQEKQSFNNTSENHISVPNCPRWTSNFQKVPLKLCICWQIYQQLQKMVWLEKYIPVKYRGTASRLKHTLRGTICTG